MNFRTFLKIGICLLCLNCGECFIPLIPVAVGGIASGLAGLGYMSWCSFKECCTNQYIPADFTLLDTTLKTKLYGQHLAHETVLHALKGHFEDTNPKKALAMSFHGLPGSGKNYMANFIVDALYKNGANSSYVHFYKGRLHFPADGNIAEYQRNLRDEITKYLQVCKRSIFIFDEVDKIPEGTLNILVPFLDYNPKLQNIDPTEAIFIFLSNTGGSAMAQHLLQLWQAGKKRDETTLADFESLLAIGAFNEKGGFHKSDTIETSLIDHYVPFLPLEEIHVEKCIIDAFLKRGVTPSNEMIQETMTHVTFGPSPHKLYSNAGCKRLDQKASAIKQKFSSRRNSKL
ncbi:torsin-1A isoform X1 [Neodiprion pinetum]|uniref:Torsin-1A isoform X1 n=1 Tax=Neodiprion lecontei TaxID=441921 RepID=A0ABM3FDY8_NEOLC|nr:torsin-1A-like isoform X1 [Neodiprion pinetum]XP_046586227.1 torsin-1A isoform X1 [Neodiprion lecontei]